MNILILGGSKGLGLACCEKFTQNGHEVTIMSRSRPSELKNINHIETNFKDIKSLENSISIISEMNIDVLINNSGGPESKAFEEVSTEEFLSEIQSHLMTAHEVTKAIVSNMKKNRFGRIINIISVTANNPLPNMIVSNTIRGAMVNWSKTLSKELGPSNITVNNVLPGYTETERLGEVIDSVAKANNKNTSEVVDGLISQIPMGKFGKPSDFAEAVYFLASKEAGYINGQSISVDGGWTSCV